MSKQAWGKNEFFPQTPIIFFSILGAGQQGWSVWWSDAPLAPSADDRFYGRLGQNAPCITKRTAPAAQRQVSKIDEVGCGEENTFSSPLFLQSSGGPLVVSSTPGGSGYRSDGTLAFGLTVVPPCWT